MSRPRSGRSVHALNTFRALALGLMLLLTFTMPRLARAQADSNVEWERFDVTVDVQDDGSFHVEERQVVNFGTGAFQTAFAELPLGRAEDIRGVTVSEDRDGRVIEYREITSGVVRRSEPETFAVSRNASSLTVNWVYPLTFGETRTFIVDYDVDGALRAYPDSDPPNQQVWWTGVSKDVTDVGPVREASISVELPRAVPLDQVVLEDGAADPSDYTEDGETWTWTARDLTEGDDFDARIQFPPIIAGALPPAWQLADDETRRRAEEQDARGQVLNLGFIALGLFLLVGGGIGTYGLWYFRGRDPHVGLVADFLTAPPDDLPPGAAGTLLDEEADQEDIVATLVDLGHRNVIRIDEEATDSSLFSTTRDFRLKLNEAQPKVRPFESDLLHALFGLDLATGATTRLSEVKRDFEAAKPEIREHLYGELVNRGYFPRSPEATRRRWQGTSRALLFIVIAVGLAAILIWGSNAGFIWFPALVLVGLAIIAGRLSGVMPRKTQAGAEAAAKWRAFRRYLDDIERYENLGEAKTIFNQYLPYAVAFGLDTAWVAKFARVRPPMPAWFEESGVFPDVFVDTYPNRRRRGGGWVTTGGGGWGGAGWGSAGDRRNGGGGGGGAGWDVPGLDIPDLQDTSDRAGRTLNRGSGGFLDMLNSAAEMFGDSSSGGGWGGGGGGSSFGGGGSRGSGGGGGGGKRGFG